ncbi:MAG: polyribonucleotide nucleotidyltransferase [Calditrichia bacterium]|jgi:polyribonucleotide nucleotidyltransferase|nr:polyribonucleotide nucleotidyltransferase [Calditrichia bacterium]
MFVSKSVQIGNKTLTIETGKLARQADGAVTVRYGDTMVLVTAVASQEAREDIDFFPLSVEYREKTYAAGKIPGGFFKREGRPSEKEILSARLIDRPIRPLFPDNFKSETQIIATIISMDKGNDADVLAAVGASTALGISDIPFEGPIASVRVGKLDGQLIVNPTISDIDKCSIEFIVAGSEDSIVMVEGEAKEISEAEMLEAIKFAHEEIKKIIALQKELISEVGKPKREIEDVEYPDNIEKNVEKISLKKLQDAILIQDKKERRDSIKEIKKEVQDQLAEEYPENEGLIAELLYDLENKETRSMMLKKSIRLDGRKPDEIRDITCEVGYLPRTHGSAIFTRGQTQSLGTTTLGTRLDEQLIDALEGTSYKKYMLHYNFPPFSTGEAKPMRGTSRREIGHGNLAERALKPVLPQDNTFPYTIRIVSDVLESNGSSSMATVCSGSLSLMDAGVPVKSAVAGIAMGLIKEDKDIMILSDILGDEDHLGDMDFKVAGTKEGITAIQMDIKIKGISYEIMESALEKAKAGRLHILDVMDKTINEPRAELSQYAPRIQTIKVPMDKIGMVIGPSGKTIKKIIEETGVSIDIDDDGTTKIASEDVEAVNKAINIVNALVKDPEIGEYYKGTVKKVTNFGAFVEILPGKEGLIHISEIDIARTNNVTDVLNVGDLVDVIVKKIDAEGKIGLSRKEYLLKNKQEQNQN